MTGQKEKDLLLHNFIDFSRLNIVKNVKKKKQLKNVEVNKDEIQEESLYSLSYVCRDSDVFYCIALEGIKKTFIRIFAD